jgi:hypothetical protein
VTINKKLAALKLRRLITWHVHGAPVGVIPEAKSVFSHPAFIHLPVALRD